jgi:hypothetical protein
MKIKRVLLLSAAIFVPMVWMLALASPANSLIQAYGVWGCAIQAFAISLFSGWMVVSFFDELGMNQQ